ncbi:ankyrin repeat domain-containing protein 17-like [Haliotis rubra]|uniref:ankyrin repeat domain-containing protein 17-like n=1 Tax=Haliotis rubra TaxID=36100 RepID=UPI001EE62F6A|nr:ankyrin repeat domain-containing protein 17-like [Haliotis rubra]
MWWVLGYVYLGCYKDDSGRLINDVHNSNDSMTYEWCLTRSRQGNYLLAGLEASKFYFMYPDIEHEEKLHHSSSPKRKDHKPGDNLLHEASGDGDLYRVQQIVTDSHVDINSREKEHGMTPAMLAAHGGHKDVFDFLVRNGCNLSVVDSTGNNNLQMACFGGHVGIVKYIVSLAIVDMNSRGQFRRTPMMTASSRGNCEVFQVLLKRGAKLTLMDKAGDNILTIACRGGHTEMAKYIISLNIVEGNTRRYHGRSRLMTAARMGNRELFETCICAGGNVTEIDADGNNILHLACCGGDVVIVKYILSHNITDINSRGVYQRTPAILAAAWGHKHAFELIVSEGGDVSKVDVHLNNILHVACLHSQFEMVKYIISQNITDINSRGDKGRTPPMMAAGKSHIGVFDFLVRKGADTSLNDSNGDNILFLACRAGQVGIVDYILSRNITDVNSRGAHWMTPIMVAASRGQIKVFHFLLNTGGNVTMLDRNGNNILHIASYHGEIKVVRYILSGNFVDINTKNKNSDTAAMIATHRGHSKVYALISRHGQSGM